MVMPIVILGQFSCSKEGESLEEIHSSEKTEYVMDISGEETISDIFVLFDQYKRMFSYYDNFMINNFENRLFQAEVNMQRTFWNNSRYDADSIAVYSLNHNYTETSINLDSFTAFASSDNYIVIGESMYKHQKVRYSFSAIAGILAHEWAHQIQFDNEWFNNRRDLMESEADFFAGYYCGYSEGGNQSWPNYVNTGLLASLEAGAGGYHGNSSQRRSAARLGWLED